MKISRFKNAFIGHVEEVTTRTIFFSGIDKDYIFRISLPPYVFVWKKNEDDTYTSYRENPYSHRFYFIDEDRRWMPFLPNCNASGQACLGLRPGPEIMEFNEKNFEEVFLNFWSSSFNSQWSGALYSYRNQFTKEINFGDDGINCHVDTATLEMLEMMADLSKSDKQFWKGRLLPLHTFLMDQEADLQAHLTEKYGSIDENYYFAGCSTRVLE